jgi:hypothetical protein
VHDISVILADKYKSGATHIRRQLINFIKSAIDDMSTKVWITKITNYKIVCFAYRIFMALQIDATNPKPVQLQAFD